MIHKLSKQKFRLNWLRRTINFDTDKINTPWSSPYVNKKDNKISGTRKSLQQGINVDESE